MERAWNEFFLFFLNLRNQTIEASNRTQFFRIKQLSMARVYAVPGCATRNNGREPIQNRSQCFSSVFHRISTFLLRVIYIEEWYRPLKPFYRKRERAVLRHIRNNVDCEKAFRNRSFRFEGRSLLFLLNRRDENLWDRFETYIRRSFCHLFTLYWVGN